MLLLKIKKPVRFKPKKYDPDATVPSGGTMFTQFIGDHPINPEQGTVFIDVALIEGSFENITDVLFIEDEPTKGRLTGYKKNLLGGYRIEVEIDTVFRHGLEYMTRHFIRRGHGIIGLSKDDSNRLHSLDIQRELLVKLAKLLLPKRSNEIVEFARPALKLLPNNKHDPTKSHFVGAPKIPANTGIPHSKENKEFFHVATIKTADIPPEYGLKGLKENLSFYLDIQSSTMRWPQDEGDFKVFNYTSGSTVSSTQFAEQEGEMNFDIQAVLDLPRWDSSPFRMMKLSDEEADRYQALESLFRNLVGNDEDMNEYNKLFGYPDSIQNCVMYEAERIKSKRDFSDAITPDALRWRLLLQVSPYAHEFTFFKEFGDGTIYYMIREDDLAQGNFEDVQVVVQNT